MDKKDKKLDINELHQFLEERRLRLLHCTDGWRQSQNFLIFPREIVLYSLHEVFGLSIRRLEKIPYEKLQEVLDLANLSRPMEKGMPHKYYVSIFFSLDSIFNFIVEYNPHVDSDPFDNK